MIRYAIFLSSVQKEFAAEREFQRAGERGKPRLIFLKAADDTSRNARMLALIRQAEASLVRRRFATTAELIAGLYAALVQWLEDRQLIRSGPFDASPCRPMPPPASCSPTSTCSITASPRTPPCCSSAASPSASCSAVR